MPDLNAWDSFYVIVGSSAGALIGLQFVVMTLIADKPQPGTREAGSAFATPTVIHFGACLLLSALVRVPWPSPIWAVGAASLLGLGGLAYMIFPIQRMRSQRTYKPDIEDFAFHIVLPLLSYGVLALSGVLCLSHVTLSLYGVGFAALLLLFVGIHNAWDAVAWQVYTVRGKDTPDIS